MSELEESCAGLDYDFVDSPPDDLQCSICLLVLSEPQLTSCCGNHFCSACVKQTQAENRPCPLCNSPTFSTMLDKYFVRKVRELKVACPQKDSGCPWIGSLGEMERHLDAKKGDCKFMIVDCPYLCGARFHHGELAGHQLSCPRRPYICKFCDYKGVYEDMSAKHWTVCEKYPLTCPNHCGEVEIERRYLDHHLNSECPLQTMECQFAYAGCQIQSHRKDMSLHVRECMQDHLTMVSQKCLSLCEQFPSEFQQRLDEKLREREAQIEDLVRRLEARDQEVLDLKAKLDSVQEELEEIKADTLQLKSTVFVPPFEFVMPKFQEWKADDEQWLGPPFYSHVGGYRMCLSVDANGTEDGYGTHVSVYINLMQGEFDDHLRWPFRGSITVQLSNQRKNEGAFEEVIRFSHGSPREAAGRVHSGEVAASGLGITKFISHAQLGYVAAKNIEYLKNDCLHFCISKVDVSK